MSNISQALTRCSLQWSGHGIRAGIIGISYKTADLALREEFARASQKISGERALFFTHPTVFLSTCNRTEIYFSADDLAEGYSDLLSLFRPALAMPFEHCLYTYFGVDCFVHLSRVTSGLDSAILAETEIQRQVKLAYSRASATLALPACIHYIFQKSLRVAKAIRSSFPLERGASTLFGTLWMLAERHFDNLKHARILLVGYSEMNRGIAAFLLHRGIRGFSLATSSPSKVRMEGAFVQGRACLASWSDFDLIVCAAKADHYLIRGQGTGRQLIFDLSMPRSADPNIQGAILWNIEQINQIVEQNRRFAEEGLQLAEVALLKHVYRLAKPKTPHGQGSGEMESHRGCFPCQ